MLADFKANIIEIFKARNFHACWEMIHGLRNVHLFCAWVVLESPTPAGTIIHRGIDDAGSRKD